LKRVAVFAVIFIVLLVVLITFLAVSRREDSGKVVLSGVVESVQHDLSFRISGLINRINYDEGDLVDSGAVIATLIQCRVMSATNALKLSCIQGQSRTLTIACDSYRTSITYRNSSPGRPNKTQFADYRPEPGLLPVGI
jgi:multidrug resistance efflux pump